MNTSASPDKRAVTGWVIYDFANTIFSMNIVTMYFAQWVVVDNKTEDIYYSISYAISMLLVAFSMPALGAVSDEKGKRVPYLFVLTSGCILATFFLGIAGQTLDNLSTRILTALILFAIANFCYEGALTFYNALLPDVSTPSTIGKVSGWGVALGYVGAIAGLLLIKPFVDGHLFGFNLSFSRGGRQDAFIPTAAFFLLFSLPTFLWIKEKVKTDAAKIKVKEAFKRVWEGISNTRKYPGVLKFLLAYYFIADAIATVIIFMAVYAQLVMGFPDAVKMWFFIVATTFAVVGSFLCGYLSDWIGPKKTLIYVVWGWIVCLSVVMLTTSNAVFWIVGPFIGICLGSTWTASRPLLTGLVPRETLGQFFGLYSLSGKVAAVAGPLLWGLAVLYLKMDNMLVQKMILFLEKIGITLSGQVMATIQYRYAIAILVLMMIVGLSILYRVPDKFKTESQ